MLKKITELCNYLSIIFFIIRILYMVLITLGLVSHIISGVNLISKLPPFQRARLKIQNKIIRKINTLNEYKELKYKDFIKLYNILFKKDNDKNITDFDTIIILIKRLIKTINLNIEYNEQYIKLAKNINQLKKKNLLINYFENKNKLLNKYPKFNDENTNNFILYLLNIKITKQFYAVVYIDDEKHNNDIYILLKVTNHNDIIRKFTYEQIKNNLSKINLLLQECNGKEINKNNYYYDNVLGFYIDFYQDKLSTKFILTLINNKLKLDLLIQSEDSEDNIYDINRIINSIPKYSSNYYLKMTELFNKEDFDFESKNSSISNLSKKMNNSILFERTPIQKGGFIYSNKKKNTNNNYFNELRLEFLKDILYNYNQQINNNITNINYNNLYNLFKENVYDKSKFPALLFSYDLENSSLYIGIMNNINYNLEDIDKYLNFEKKILGKNNVSENKVKDLKYKLDSYIISSVNRMIIIKNKIKSYKNIRNMNIIGGGLSEDNKYIFYQTFLNMKKNMN